MKIKAHASLTEKAYQTLVHKIVMLELAPGSVLTEGRLIHEMKIGRTPRARQRRTAAGCDSANSSRRRSSRVRRWPPWGSSPRASRTS